MLNNTREHIKNVKVVTVEFADVKFGLSESDTEKSVSINFQRLLIHIRNKGEVGSIKLV